MRRNNNDHQKDNNDNNNDNIKSLSVFLKYSEGVLIFEVLYY